MWTSNTRSWNSQAGQVRYYYYATVEELQQDEDLNRTQIRIKFYARGAYDPQYDGHSSTGYIYVDGSQVASGAGPSTLGTSYKQILSTTLWVNHEEDGTKTISLGVKLTCSGSGSYLPASGTVNLSPNCTLTKINRGLMHVKVSGAWKSGKPYVKVNGNWELGQAFIKVSGNWERGI